MSKKYALTFEKWAKIKNAEECQALSRVCDDLALRWQRPARYYWVGFIDGTGVKVEYWPTTGKWKHLGIIYHGTPKDLSEYINEVVRDEANIVRREWLREAQ